MDVVATPPISAEGSSTHSVTLKLPDATDPVWRTGLPGTYTISMLVDAFDQLVEWDEENNVTSVNVAFAAPATVVGRHLFYNNSRADNNDSEATADDDLAIAPDKVAWGQGDAASPNNISYSANGINGIAIDVAGLAGRIPTVRDFEFGVAASPNAVRFTTPPDPTLSFRSGVGVNGSDRITLTWPDGTIVNRWLRVELKHGDDSTRPS